MRVLAFSKTTTKGLGLVSQWLTVVGEIAEGGGFDKLNYSISCNSSVYVRRCDRYPVTHPTQLANDHLHTLDDSPFITHYIHISTCMRELLLIVAKLTLTNVN